MIAVYRTVFIAVGILPALELVTAPIVLLSSPNALRTGENYAFFMLIIACSCVGLVLVDILSVLKQHAST